MSGDGEDVRVMSERLDRTGDRTAEPTGALAAAPSSRSRGSRSQTLERALDAVAVLSDGRPRTSAQLAIDLGLHRSIVYRILRTLEDYHFVTRAADGRYTLGLGIAALAEAGIRNAALQVEAIVEELADAAGATALFCVVQKDHAVVLASARPSTRAAAVTVRRSTRFALEAGAPGMAILALDAPREHEQDEIALARSRGYVHTKGSPFAGFEAVARPVRLRDGQAASLAVIFPVAELRHSDMLRPLHQAALRVEHPGDAWSV